eukprot:scaffold36083_cov112-Isochrysis_galbana.AAC.5
MARFWQVCTTQCRGLRHAGRWTCPTTYAPATEVVRVLEGVVALNVPLFQKSANNDAQRGRKRAAHGFSRGCFSSPRKEGRQRTGHAQMRIPGPSSKDVKGERRAQQQ